MLMAFPFDEGLYLLMNLLPTIGVHLCQLGVHLFSLVYYHFLMLGCLTTVPRQVHPRPFCLQGKVGTPCNDLPLKVLQLQGGPMVMHDLPDVP